MTNDEIPKPEGNGKPEARSGDRPLFGLGRFGLLSSLGISSFVKGIAYEAMLEAAGNPRLGNGR